MALGAMTTAWVQLATGSMLVALIAGSIAGALLGFTHATLTVVGKSKSWQAACACSSWERGLLVSGDRLSSADRCPHCPLSDCRSYRKYPCWDQRFFPKTSWFTFRLP